MCTLHWLLVFLLYITNGLHTCSITSEANSGFSPCNFASWCIILCLIQLPKRQIQYHSYIWMKSLRFNFKNYSVYFLSNQFYIKINYWCYDYACLGLISNVAFINSDLGILICVVFNIRLTNAISGTDIIAGWLDKLSVV